MFATTYLSTDPLFVSERHERRSWRCRGPSQIRPPTDRIRKRARGSSCFDSLPSCRVFGGRPPYKPNCSRCKQKYCGTIKLPEAEVDKSMLSFLETRRLRDKVHIKSNGSPNGLAWYAGASLQILITCPSSRAQGERWVHCLPVRDPPSRSALVQWRSRSVETGGHQSGRLCAQALARRPSATRNTGWSSG